MRTHPARRTIGDVRSVWHSACPAAATRWFAAFVAHLPECARSHSLSPADRAWTRAGARFRTASGAMVSLSGTHPGAREMYCWNIYLRTGLTMPTKGWVVNLGANRGLFSVWAAVTGAQAIAVEAQDGFGPMIRSLAAHNGVADPVHVEIALASGAHVSAATVGVLPTPAYGRQRHTAP